MMSADIPTEMNPVQQGKIRKALSQIHTQEEFDKLFSEAIDGSVKQEPLKGGSVADVLKKMEEMYPGFAAPPQENKEPEKCPHCGIKNPFQQTLKHIDFYREFIHLLGLHESENQRFRDKLFKNAEFLDFFLVEELNDMIILENKNKDRKKRLEERMEMINKSMVSVFINKK